MSDLLQRALAVVRGNLPLVTRSSYRDRSLPTLWDANRVAHVTASEPAAVMREVKTGRAALGQGLAAAPIDPHRRRLPDGRARAVVVVPDATDTAKDTGVRVKPTPRPRGKFLQDATPPRVLEGPPKGERTS